MMKVEEGNNNNSHTMITKLDKTKNQYRYQVSRIGTILQIYLRKLREIQTNKKLY